PPHRHLHSFPTRRSSDLVRDRQGAGRGAQGGGPRPGEGQGVRGRGGEEVSTRLAATLPPAQRGSPQVIPARRGGTTEERETDRRSEEHTSELQSPYDLVC